MRLYGQCHEHRKGGVSVSEARDRYVACSDPTALHVQGEGSRTHFTVLRAHSGALNVKPGST